MYTLSPALSRAVREAFVRLFERGLIYELVYVAESPAIVGLGLAELDHADLILELALDLADTRERVLQ